MKYALSPKQKDLYLQICDNGIGWNIGYAKGTMEKGLNGKIHLKQEKAKMLYHDIMSRYITFITIEGGKRGGKDVYGLYCWANYLMTCPDRLHLVTGQTINHAVQTVLKADGFGIEYLLPHGELHIINNAPVYIFTDFYGVEKQIMFFGGQNADDSEKFRGISFGSCYCNEAIKQNIKTITEAKDRTMASKWRKIIHTQNPEAGTFDYYDVYEKPLSVLPQEMEEIDRKQMFYKGRLTETKQLIENKVAEDRKKIDKLFMKKFNVESVDDLKKAPSIFKKYVTILRDNRVKIERENEELLRQDYVYFCQYYENPNSVRNGLNFRYFHFTCKDNLSMTDLDREKIEKSYDTTSVAYRRNILGIRASSDNAIWDTFGQRNMLSCEIPNYSTFERYLSIDYGMKNAFVILDSDINDDLSIDIWKEDRFDGRKASENTYAVLPTNDMYASMVEKMINSRNGGHYSGVIIDPSATSLINELRARGISVIKAKNQVGTRDVTDKENADKKIDKQAIGIWLVRDGFAKGKIRIHISCKDTINEVTGYCFDPKKLAIGIEEPLKINDHGCDCIRYLANTVVKKSSHWV